MGCHKHAKVAKLVGFCRTKWCFSDVYYELMMCQTCKFYVFILKGNLSSLCKNEFYCIEVSIKHIRNVWNYHEIMRTPTVI